MAKGRTASTDLISQAAAEMEQMNRDRAERENAPQPKAPVIDAEFSPAAEEAPKEQEKKTEAQVPATTTAAPRPPVQMDERGRQGSFDLEQAFRLASALFKGKGFPSWVKSAEQALAVSLFLKNLGLEVMTGIQHVCEVNGRLTLWGEGPLAAVRASGNLKSIKEGFYDKDFVEISFKNKNLLTAELAFAYCVTTRKDNGERKETWFSLNDEKTANKGIDAIWRGYRRTMYKRKARAENLKDNFGDVLQGAGISEYDNEAAPDMRIEGAPEKMETSLSDQMNQKMLEGSSEQTVQN